MGPRRAALTSCLNGAPGKASGPARPLVRAARQTLITTSTQRGIYIVLLVAQDLSCTYLTLNQGMTELVAEHKQSGAVALMRERARTYRQQLGALAAVGFNLDDEIDLATEGWRSKNYEVGSIAYKRYDIHALPDDAQVAGDFAALLEAYDLITASFEVANERPAWFVGSSWGDNREEDQTQRFLTQGIWENGFTEGPTLDEVRTIQPGDRIAIKSTFTRKNDLPFRYPAGDGQRRSMRIKAIGFVTENVGDGRTLKVSLGP